MFDEYFNPLTITVSPLQEAVAPKAEVLANSHVSNSISQDAPSTNADHAGCQDIRRSISGSPQFLGDKFVSWSSNKQKCTAISSTEAKYIPNLGVVLKSYGCVDNGIMKLYFVRTEYQLAGIFTKPLPRERFNFLIEKLGIKSMYPNTLKHMAEETDE
nr:copia protein [Tanacetum cinerariifolium]